MSCFIILMGLREGEGILKLWSCWKDRLSNRACFWAFGWVEGISGDYWFRRFWRLRGGLGNNRLIFGCFLFVRG
jgi:hypothetical protein